ncbi:MAG: hypothetical protein ACAH95_08940 [Fimbriimonas sp.]
MKRLQGITVVEGILVLLIIVLILAFLFPTFSGGHGSPKTACLSNLKQVGIGQLIYASDHDDRTLLGPGWMDVAAPYLKIEHVYTCSEVKKGTEYGYAFNQFMGGAKIGSVDDATKHVFYDTRNLERSVCEFLPQFPVPGRHSGFNTIAYADSHARALRMDPEPSK